MTKLEITETEVMNPAHYEIWDFETNYWFVSDEGGTRMVPIHSHARSGQPATVPVSQKSKREFVNSTVSYG